MRGLRIPAWCVAATTVGLVVVGALRLLEVIPGHEEVKPIYWVVGAFVAVAVLTPTFVGLAILTRMPRNIVGWILLVGATTVIAPLVGEALGGGWMLQMSRATWPCFTPGRSRSRTSSRTVA